MQSVSDVIDAIEDIRTRIIAAGMSIRSALQSGTQTEQQIEGLRASLAGVLKDISDLRAEMDGTDAVDLLRVQDGERTILAWTWQRETRRALVQMAAAARQVMVDASNLEGGTDRRLVVTKEGDSLQTVAAREMGDWREWPRLLRANPGVQVGELEPGTTLVVPA